MAKSVEHGYMSLHALGAVSGIFIAPAAGSPMVSLASVKALAHQGLEGDRYLTGTGTYSKGNHGSRYVTLFTQAAVETLKLFGISIAASDLRRNILVTLEDLRPLLGVMFTVGEVQMRGVQICTPCMHLERLTNKPDLMETMLIASGNGSLGGIYASVRTDGIIRLGDNLTICSNL